ncbi:MAG: DNA-binding YbaB/EbfC family protein [Paraglaciecola sp.]|jgi:DNA-binding YbaB/EbfC family protein
MFDNLMGNMEEQQAAMQEKLATILVEVEAGDGAIKVQASANKQITNISIDATKMDLTDKEELEDLLLVAINRVLELAEEKAGVETQSLLKDMMPPGLGNLFG